MPVWYSFGANGAVLVRSWCLFGARLVTKEIVGFLPVTGIWRWANFQSLEEVSASRLVHFGTMLVAVWRDLVPFWSHWCMLVPILEPVGVKVGANLGFVDVIARWFF